MTPEDKQRAQELHSKATPGEWRYENLNWIGSPIFGVYASSGPGDRGTALFENIECNPHSYFNIEFMIAAHNLLPKMLSHVEALEANLAAAKEGKPAPAAPVLTAKEIAAVKETMEEYSTGAWSWQDDRHTSAKTYTVYANRTGGAGSENLFGRMDTGPNAENDLNFITGASTLVPKLLTHIDALETLIALQRKPTAPAATSSTPKAVTGPRP